MRVTEGFKMDITEQLTHILQPKLEELGCFLVDFEINQNHKIIVYIDHDKDMNIAICAQVSRFLNKHPDLQSQLETHGLEVSSPDLDKPLRHFRQYKKNIGRTLDIDLNDGSSKKGKLLEVVDGKLLLENAEKELPDTISIDNVKTSKVEISFK